MSIKRVNTYGNINVTKEAIATLVGGVVSECYGVVGMASRNIIKDGFAELLKYDNYSKGVIVNANGKGIDIEVYIVIGFNMKVTEVVSEVQKKIIYITEKALQTNVVSCNVYVQGIKVIG